MEPSAWGRCASRPQYLGHRTSVEHSDGAWIAMRLLDSDTAQNVYLLPTTGEVVAQPYVKGPGRDEAVAVSPNGRWMAYLGEDTGTQQLYVQAFPKPAGRIQVSTEGVLWA